jgi:hypothetical protein
MCTKWFADGDVQIFQSLRHAVRSVHRLQQVLHDLRLRIESAKKKKPSAPKKVTVVKKKAAPKKAAKKKVVGTQKSRA